MMDLIHNEWTAAISIVDDSDVRRQGRNHDAQAKTLTVEISGMSNVLPPRLL